MPAILLSKELKTVKCKYGSQILFFHSYKYCNKYLIPLIRPGAIPYREQGGNAVLCKQSTQLFPCIYWCTARRAFYCHIIIICFPKCTFAYSLEQREHMKLEQMRSLASEKNIHLASCNFTFFTHHGTLRILNMIHKDTQSNNLQKSYFHCYVQNMCPL